MFNDKDVADITRNLLIALGIEIQKGSNILFYQESKNTIFFDNHPVKANIDSNSALFIDKDDVRFNPLDPRCTKLMDRFFARYLEDSSEEGNLPVCSTYFFDKDKDTGNYMLHVRFEDGSEYKGNWYINKIICLIEAVFSLDGTFADINLKPYDLDQSEWIDDE